MITPDNVVPILNGACYLESEELAEFCRRSIIAFLRVGTILPILGALDAADPGNGPRWGAWTNLAGHRYPVLLHQVITSLRGTMVHFLVRLLVSYYLTDYLRLDCQEAEAGEVDRVVEQLPLHWIHAALSSDALCAKDEFERYELAKTVFGVRRLDLTRISLEQGQATPAARAVHPTNSPAATASATARNFFATFLDNVMPMRKKRKGPDVDGEEGASSAAESPTLAHAALPPLATGIKPTATAGFFGTRKIKQPKSSWTSRPSVALASPASASATPATDAEVVGGYFKRNIHYCHMSFAQLDVVKRDAIVAESVVLECFWMQAELANRHARRALPSMSPAASRSQVSFPPFRFSGRFSNVDSWVAGLSGDGGPGEFMHSAPILCAGVQYRLSITPVTPCPTPLMEGGQGDSPHRTFRALLQRHHPELRGNLSSVTTTPLRAASPIPRAELQGAAIAAPLTSADTSISYRIWGCVPHSAQGITLLGAMAADLSHPPTLTRCDASGDGRVEEFAFDTTCDLVLSVAIYFS
jgi:hypothetical protein